MTTVADIIHTLEAFAPLELAYDWDNSGLQVGSRKTPVTKVMVALDPFEGAVREAVRWGAQMVVTHHPLLFKPVQSITDETSQGRVIQLLLENHMSLWSGHTNVDVAPGGVNDTLAQALGLRDIHPVAPENLLRVGIVEEQPLSSFLSTVKNALHCPGLRYSDSGKICRKIAVGGGACAGELEQAIGAGCDTFVTADVKYNQFWNSFDVGMNLIDAGHYWTENPVCNVLADQIRAQFPHLEVKISETHRDCMNFF